MRTTLAGGLVAAALIGGCGGGEDDKSADSPQTSSAGGAEPLSKEEFVRRGDELCRDFRAKSPDTGDPDSFDELKRQVDQVLPAAQETLEKFEQLEPPADDKEVVDSYMQTQRDQLTLIRQLGEAAEAEDQSAVQRYAADVRESAQKGKGIAQGYGFKVCGSDEATT
jgi:hypothetical protein